MNEIVRRDPFTAIAPMEDIFFAVPGMFRAGVARDTVGAMRTDVTENDTSYQLAIELAGVKKEAIEVTVSDNSVTVAAELPDGQDGEKDETQWLLRERPHGKLSRTIALPDSVDDQASEARYVDGVLYLTLKKKNNVKRLTIH